MAVDRTPRFSPAGGATTARQAAAGGRRPRRLAGPARDTGETSRGSGGVVGAASFSKAAYGGSNVAGSAACPFVVANPLGVAWTTGCRWIRRGNWRRRVARGRAFFNRGDCGGECSRVAPGKPVVDERQFAACECRRPAPVSARPRRQRSSLQAIPATCPRGRLGRNRRSGDKPRSPAQPTRGFAGSLKWTTNS